MASTNPFANFRSECETILAEALKTTLPETSVEPLPFSKPSNPNFGQLASSVCFELAKKLKKNPTEISVQLSQAVNKNHFVLIEKVEPAGCYVNFYVNFSEFSELTLESISQLGQEYGLIKTDNPKKIIVEHTSVNPLHPIHIGQARNPILGDSLARILTSRGHIVSRHYYIDDVGRQSSVIAYGYEKLGRPMPTEKNDHFVGKIYTITACLVEINRLKRQLDLAKAIEPTEDTAKLTKELDEWLSIAGELEDKYPALFKSLLEKIGEDKNPEEQINQLNRSYENGEPQAKQLVREVSELCLEGFRKTQRRVKISYDSWDWESDFVWNGQVSKVLGMLEGSGFVYSENGVLEFNAEKVIASLSLRKKLALREEQEVPPLTLVRADGTTLYTTRDVAYTLWKFERAQKVVNVIGMEQSLSQLQLKVALYALDLTRQAENLVHFGYSTRVQDEQPQRTLHHL
jgi:arginyl-tRNA synthetase